jgi:hypothetical protein
MVKRCPAGLTAADHAQVIKYWRYAGWPANGAVNPVEKAAKLLANASTNPEQPLPHAFSSLKKPERVARSCNSALANQYFNEKLQCDDRRATHDKVCKDEDQTDPAHAPGCYAEEKAVYASCIHRLSTVYPPEIRQCPTPTP